MNSGRNNVAAQLGIPYNPIPQAWGAPNFSGLPYATVGDGNWQPRIGNTYLIGDTINYTRGSHTMKTGFEWRRLEFPSTRSSQPSFTFNGNFTGSAFADFLLGLPSQTSQNPQIFISYQYNYTYAGFFQDDWKVARRLTLNMGLRYEYNSPVIERQNRLAQVNVLTGQYDIAGQNGTSRAMYNPDWRDWEPRFGFAFRPTDSSKSVIRGAYGIYRDLVSMAPLALMRQGPPFTSPQTYTAPCSGSGSASILHQSRQGQQRHGTSLWMQFGRLRPA